MTPETTGGGSTDDLVEALVQVGRVMVGLAARSLADLDAEVTLPQYRALVVLACRGPRRVVDISTELGVNPSTGTRMCDRLVRKGLARRDRDGADRREVRLTLTGDGRRMVDEVTARRRAELDVLVQGVSPASRAEVAKVLTGLAAAAGDVPQNEWWMGWTSGTDQGRISGVGTTTAAPPTAATG